jgi:hypothetical protein
MMIASDFKASTLHNTVTYIASFEKVIKGISSLILHHMPNLYLELGVFLAGHLFF